MISIAFRSGMSRSNDLHAGIDASVPVGVVAGELQHLQQNITLPKYLAKGGSVFIDSGAFAELKTGEPPDFLSVLDTYTLVAEMAVMLDTTPSSLFVVAPDKVGSQSVSLERLALHRQKVRALIDMGVQVIVPIQSGAVHPNVAIAVASAILGTAQFIVGIPSNAAAMSIAECATIKHHHGFHILGRVQKNEEQIARIAALQTLQPGARITADANWLRSNTDTVCRITGTLKLAQAKQPGWQVSARTRAVTQAIQADTQWSK